MIGRLAVNHQGRIARIVSKSPDAWHGVSIYDDQPWSSREPVLIAVQTERAMIRDRILPVAVRALHAATWWVPWSITPQKAHTLWRWVRREAGIPEGETK